MPNGQSDCASKPQDHWIKVHVRDLVLGMFVIELDRPWRDTPFPINGFHLRKFDQVQTLRTRCQFVYIDPGKGASPRSKSPTKLTILSSARKRAPESAVLKVCPDVYPRTRSVKQEIDKASHLYAQLESQLDRAIANAREHKPLELAEIYRLARETIACVIRNPDGFIWYLNTSEQGDCLLKHSIRAAVWATVFACHVGMTKSDIEPLLVGTLLADIGMAKFAPQFVRKNGPFSRAEYLHYQKHVGIGVDILRAEEHLDQQVVSIVRAHHERHDGRGFPRRQRGDHIPMLARIANLAYSYERMLRRSSEADLSPATAISRLYKQRKIKFADQLVYEFIKALGMFPAGSVVELATGEVGIVTEQNPNQRLSPKITVVTNARKQPRSKFELINQGEQQDQEMVRSITRSLKRGSYNIDPASFTSELFGRRIGIGKLGLRF
jgi:HD-GYP domain-containing protein (c-di-GMP phosphodiesterase class II)